MNKDDNQNSAVPAEAETTKAKAPTALYAVQFHLPESVVADRIFLKGFQSRAERRLETLFHYFKLTPQDEIQSDPWTLSIAPYGDAYVEDFLKNMDKMVSAIDDYCDALMHRRKKATSIDAPDAMRHVADRSHDDPGFAELRAVLRAYRKSAPGKNLVFISGEETRDIPIPSLHQLRERRKIETITISSYVSHCDEKRNLVHFANSCILKVRQLGKRIKEFPDKEAELVVVNAFKKPIDRHLVYQIADAHRGSDEKIDPADGESNL